MGHQFAGQNAHETGQYHQPRIITVDTPGQLDAKFFATGERAVIDTIRWQARASGERQASRFWFVANNRAKMDWQLARIDSIDY